MSKISHTITNFYKSYRWRNDRKSIFTLILSLNRASLYLADLSARKIHAALCQGFYLPAFTTSQAVLFRDNFLLVYHAVCYNWSPLQSPTGLLSRFNPMLCEILGMVLLSLLLVRSHAVLCWHNLLRGRAGREQKQLKLNLPEKRDPFQLNQLWDLVQHWALQTSAPVGEQGWQFLTSTVKFFRLCSFFSIILCCHFSLCAKQI